MTSIQTQPLARPAVLFAGSKPPTREKTVAVYGGNSMKPDTPMYKEAMEIGKALGNAGFGILTGGGSGAMEAVTLGAKEAGAYTFGMAMPFIGETHSKLKDELKLYNTFSERLDDGYEKRAGRTASVPGGIGTLQELTKKATELFLNKTVYPAQKRIVLFEHGDYWQKFLDYLQKGPVKHGLMDPGVLKLFTLAHSPEQGVKQLKENVPWTTGIPSEQRLPEGEREAPRVYKKQPDQLGPSRFKVVQVYGGKRVKEGSRLFQLSKALGRTLADNGYGVLTGGADGTLKGVIQGAKSRDGYVINISVPVRGQSTSPDADETYEFSTLSDNIDFGMEARSAYTVALPGGIGTLLQLTKKATEMYVDKTMYPSQKQILLVDYKNYWKKFLDYLEKGPIAAGLLSPKMLGIFKIVPVKDLPAALKANTEWTTGVMTNGNTGSPKFSGKAA